MEEHEDSPDAEEERNELFKTLVHNIMELAIHVGLINVVMSQYPEHVQEGWVERLREMDNWVNQQISEVQEFGSAFEDEEEG